MPFDTIMIHDVDKIVVSEVEVLPIGTYYRKITIWAKEQKIEAILFSGDATTLSLKEEEE